jgi:hypothetical protein
MLPIDDLRWLLTSPSLIAPGHLPDGVADGNAALGEVWWQSLDHEALRQTLAHQHPTAPFRVGRYAESLMQAALSHLPAHTLLASQLPVRLDGVSLGEYDFLLRAPDALLHIELAVKIYIALTTDIGLCYVGPGLHDALELKLARLFQHQLRLSTTPAGRTALPVDEPVQPMAWLRGWMFYREEGAAAWPVLAADHLRGWWRCWGEPLPRKRNDSLWRSLPKPDWLAPRIADGRAQPFDAWATQAGTHFAQSKHPILVAEYAPLDEGGAEIARGMVLSPDWPDPAWLGKLLAQLSAPAA